MNAESTKHKILQTALELFSTNGYAATSVRDIARQAEVNVSAVSYHFDSKHGLYAAVIKDSKAAIKSYIDSLYHSKSQWDIRDFVEALSDLFHKHRVRIMATFKVLLNNVELDTEVVYSQDDNPKGPPGTEYLMEVIQKMKRIDNEETIFKISNITMNYIMHKTICIHCFDEKSLDLPAEHMSWDYSKEMSLFLIDQLLK